MIAAIGIISDTDAAKAKAKAKLPDRGGIETDWLPVLQLFTLGAMSYAMPRLGQQAYVVLFGETAADGFIFGSRYSSPEPPPRAAAEPDWYLALEDGTKIHLIKDGGISVETPGTATIKAGGDIAAEAGGSAKIKAAGALDAEAGGNATIKAAEIKLDAPLVKITGALEVAQDATIGGKAYLPHRHASAAPGSPTSTPL